MKILLIPSAILMPKEMSNILGDLPAVLFPLGDTPMISGIYEQYKNSVDEIYIVAFQKKDKIQEYINSKLLPVKIIELDELKDLGYTIRYGLQKIFAEHSNIDYLYINFADSLLNEPLTTTNSNFTYFAEMDLNEQWTYFKECGGYLTDILDKGNFENNGKPDKNFKNIFVGVFGISDARKFFYCFDSDAVESSTDSFYRAFQKYAVDEKIKFLPANNWIDVGHYEKYVKAQTKVATRYFNFIEIDDMRGVLKKSSQNKEKLINEISWYLKIPKQLQYLLPRIYDYSLDFESPYVKMEFYGYRTMHEFLLYGELPDSMWREIFSKLLFAFKDMQTYRINGRTSEINAAVKEMYVEKTLKRFSTLQKDTRFNIFFTQNIKVNGKQCHSLNEIEKLLPELVQRLLVDDAEKFFSIIHGDLCFPNILIEETYKFIRLVDPRGKFGAFDIYGDSRYDLAKLLHTLEGKYDCIIEDMFSVESNATQVDYKILMDYSKVNRIFWEIFGEMFENQLQAIRLIESTLFLSMIPLHSNSFKRQLVMLATGVELFETVLQNMQKG